MLIKFVMLSIVLVGLWFVSCVYVIVIFIVFDFVLVGVIGWLCVSIIGVGLFMWVIGGVLC